MKDQIIKSEVSWKRQSAHYDRLFTLNGHKLKIAIKRDSYAFQSYARISHFINGAWVELSFIPYPKMNAVKEGSSHKPQNGNEVPFRNACKPDVQRLLAEAKFILGDDDEKGEKGEKDDLQSVEIVVEYEDVEDPSLRLGGVLLPAVLDPDQCVAVIKPHWEAFQGDEPDSDSQFIDYLKDKGFETYETVDITVVVRG